MTKYNAQTAAALEYDYHFLAFRLGELNDFLRHNPGEAEAPISTEDDGLFWLVNRRAKEYGITPPEKTNANTYVVGREVFRETKRRHAKQMAAYIRQNLDRKYGKDNE